MEFVPKEQFVTTVPAPEVTGRARKFGRNTAGMRAKLVKDGVVVPLDEPAKKVGLDLGDVDTCALQQTRYSISGNAFAMVPMDLMSLQPLVNREHLKEAELDPHGFPHDGAGLLELARATTNKEGG